MSFFSKISLNKKIMITFVLVIVLQLVLGLISMSWMWKLSSGTSRFYNHPYRVSNATRDIVLNIIEIDSHMKDLVSMSGNNLDAGIDDINQHEMIVLKSLDIISQRYLGDRADIENINRDFSSWRSIHYRVIGLFGSGRKSEAAELLRGEGAEKIAQLNLSIKKVAEFASNKAENIYMDSISSRDTALKTQGLVLLIIIIVSIYIAAAVFIKITHAHEVTDRRIRDYLHLIDQNIYIVSMDSGGMITEISNSFCRMLGILKSDLTGKDWKILFINRICDEEILHDIWKILQTGASWKGEICRLQNNGEEQWFELSLHPVFDTSYQKTGFSIIADDITDKKIIQRISEIDPLTSLRNRRSYDEILASEINRAYRQKNTLTVAVLDIDHFKKYNDYYGHLSGDQALIRVAEVIQSKMSRSSDYAFRIGGEEFALVFSGLTMDESSNFLDELRKSVEQTEISHESSDVSDKLTVSIGAKYYSGESMLDSVSIFAHADRSLYTAKKKRNTVIIA